MGVECQPELPDTSFRIIVGPKSEDDLEDINGDIGDVNIGKHNEEVAEPAAHGGSRQDVDGGEVAQEADCPDDESGPPEDGPDSVVGLCLPFSDVVPTVPTPGLRGIHTLLPKKRSHTG